MQALAEPEQLEEAQRAIVASAPSLQRIFNQALESADWYGSARRAEVVRAAGVADPDDRMKAVGMLIDEESRVSMMIGATVGFELAHRLLETPTETQED